MTQPIAPTDEQSKCPECNSPVWRAKFGSRPENPDWRLVELAPATVGPSSDRLGLSRRPRGHVALTFPLVAGEPIRGAVVRGLTRYRIHQHGAFSAAPTRAERKAVTR